MQRLYICTMFNRVVKAWNDLAASIVNLISFESFKITKSIHKLRIHCSNRTLLSISYNLFILELCFMFFFLYVLLNKRTYFEKYFFLYFWTSKRKDYG